MRTHLKCTKSTKSTAKQITNRRDVTPKNDSDVNVCVLKSVRAKLCLDS